MQKVVAIMNYTSKVKLTDLGSHCCLLFPAERWEEFDASPSKSDLLKNSTTF